MAMRRREFARAALVMKVLKSLRTVMSEVQNAWKDRERGRASSEGVPGLGVGVLRSASRGKAAFAFFRKIFFWVG